MIHTIRFFAVGRWVVCLFLPACGLLLGCGINSGSAPSYAEYQASLENAKSSIAEKGKVEEKQYPPGKGLAVTLSGVTITDADIKSLRAMDDIAELDLSGATISDEQITQLVASSTNDGHPPSRLFRLNISDTPITDAGLKELSSLNFLSHLNLKGSKVTDAGVKAFEQAKSGKKMPFGLKLKIEK